MKRIQTSFNRFSRLLLICSLSLSLLLLLLYSTSTAYVAPLSDVGFLDFSYGSETARDVTGEKPESKLWWNDGFWWASMFNATALEYRIYRLHWPTQTWEDTGVALDPRPTSKADVMWDEENQKLYVASHISKDPAVATADPTEQGHLYRYSYNKETRTYSLDAGFPVSVNADKTETLVLTKDSNGRLWVAYISEKDGDQVVFVNSSNGGTLADDNNWGTPTALPFPEATVAEGDIASIAAFNNNGTDSVAVFWSNQLDGGLHIGLHNDLFPQDSGWVHINAPIPNGADDHLSVQSLQATNGGQLFAVIKTGGGLLNDSLIGVVARDTNGVFSYHSYSRVTDKDSRPILVIDDENKDLYVFVSDRAGGRKICYKKADITTPLRNMSFANGNCGQVFLEDETLTKIDNATTTKQHVNSHTGLVVLASDDDNGSMYVHNFVTQPAPTTISHSPASNETDVEQDSTISIQFSKQMDETTLNDGTILVEDQFGNFATGAVSYISETQTAVFSPTNPLSASVLYSVSLTNGIKDTNGQVLNDWLDDPIRKQWNFSTVGPTVSLSSDLYEVFEDEASGTANVVVTLNAPSGIDVMVDLQTMDETAVSGEDYMPISTTVTIPAGEQSVVVSIPLINNDLSENDETLSLALSNPVNALLVEPSSAFVLIIDDEALPKLQFGAASYNVDESDESVTVEVTVDPTSAAGITVDVAPTGGTAVNGEDFDLTVPTQLSITASSAVVTFTVGISEDLAYEGMETIELSLTNPQGVDKPRVGIVGTTTINIRDNEPVPTVQLSHDTYTTTETAVSRTITATLDAAAAVAVSVDYETSDGTATAGADYEMVTGTLTFAPGETTQTFDLPILDDVLNEATETAIVTLLNPVLVNLGNPISATVEIEDDDPQPVVNFETAETAVDEATGTVTVTLTLSEPSGRPVEVSYAPTMSGTATTGSDYSQATGSVIFPALTTSQTISITIIDDSTDEPEESLVLELTGADFATIGDDDIHTITITDNDEMPVVAFGDIEYQTIENSGVASVVVALSAPSEFTVTVDISSIDNTALAGADYIEVLETITFTPGMMSQTFNVMINDDNESERKESFLLLLSNPNHATLNNNDTTVSIIDDDLKLIYLPVIRRAP